MEIVRMTGWGCMIPFISVSKMNNSRNEHTLVLCPARRKWWLKCVEWGDSWRYRGHHKQLNGANLYPQCAIEVSTL